MFQRMNLHSGKYGSIVDSVCLKKQTRSWEGNVVGRVREEFWLEGIGDGLDYIIFMKEILKE